MKLEWDKIGERFYETGVSNVALYPVTDQGNYGSGVAWNGVISVSENPSGAEASPLYADNVKYLNLTSAEEFGATIEAYTYPDEFAACDGSVEIATGISVKQQKRKMFGLCYKTQVGNDTEGETFGYKIHIIYGAKAAPSQKGFNTINDSPEAITFSWEISTTAVPVDGLKPTASVEIDSRTTESTKLKAIEDLLYGTESNEPELPLPSAISALVGAAG